MHRYPIRGAACLLSAALMAACTPQPVQPPRPAGLVTPATTFCHAQGGRTLLGYTAEGRETLCFLPDGSLVDESQLYRREHPCK
ncbi:DUF333 domain-containing protein [Comamonas endophytica]|uniref:DUF333 domain-containing protein n=1 Tax=Comamonas endophytica TaxID=2949090 RepID=A0ABY6G9F9_9BURK|nr:MULTISPECIES: DUF333 domain-containing protein [unclassified Acidovorax]MCD2514251.1 DUF333 domain-containing protein [Acidovorax sp. D4N7]UYG51390.1 DUF333 domain-containing protein [Acidovorax sp. 5MLIR]